MLFEIAEETVWLGMFVSIWINSYRPKGLTPDAPYNKQKGIAY